jgi:hypothetical protein
MSAFDELQRQLLDSVVRRQAGVGGHEAAGYEAGVAEHETRIGAPRSRRSWWHPGEAGPRRWIALIAVPLVFAAAAAAAKIVTQSGESPENVLINRVLGETGRSASCRMTGPRKSGLSNEAPDAVITATLPALARPPHDPPSPAVVALAERNSGGAVLARTIRVVALPDGLSLIEYVAHGEGPFTLVDPRRCLQARLARLAALRPRAHDRLREIVAQELRRMSETNPGTQSLTLTKLERRPGAPLDGGGASFPVVATEATLATGVLFSGSGCEYARPGHPAYCSPIYFGGIVKPDTAYLTLQPAPRATWPGTRPIRRRIGVNEGLFLFTVPRRTGPELVVQHARDGKVLAESSLQGTRPRARGGSEEVVRAVRATPTTRTPPSRRKAAP